MSSQISIEKEDLPNTPQPHSANVKTVSTILNNFADATTAHGIPRIITRPRATAKLFWFFLVGIALCIFCYQTSNLMRDYYGYHTNVELVSSENVEFPAVTICNFNKIKLSKMLHNGRFGTVHEKWKGMIKDTVENYMWMWSSSDPWFNDYFDSFEPTSSESDEVRDRTRERRATFTSSSEYSSNDYSSYSWETILQFFARTSDDFIHKTPDTLNLSREELRKFGHRAEDFILQCTFNTNKCFHSDFITFQNKRYGNCFTFNMTDKQRGKRRFITKVGSDHGLHLTLFIEHFEYVGILTEESGIRLAIHPRDILPHPEEVGFSIAPGFSSSIGIRQVELKRLGDPHSTCSDGHDKDYLNSDTHNYSIISCQKKCLLDNMADKCGCVNNIYDDYDDVPQCQPSNSTQVRCSRDAEKNFTTNKLQCDCPAPCHEYIYNSRLSSAVWPSEDYQQHLREKLLEQNKTVAYILNATKNARKNLVRVKIYFEELNYELIEQVPKYTVDSLLGSIGGLLGLYLGFSLITVCEVTVLFYDLINSVVRKALSHDRNV